MSVFDSLIDVVPLLMGPLIAYSGWQAWRKPDAAPHLASGSPRWGLFCWSVGFVLLGVTVTTLGGFGLAGQEEPRPLVLVRMAAAGLVAVAIVVAAGCRVRRRHGRPRRASGTGGG
ncbi:hypothetical protein [Streptomyces sp. NPDC006274]|uniref:hypothetical protein n=1 Tax=unclassified Streptomyces TaxID=2593676 RepID=UPI00339EE9C4